MNGRLVGKVLAVVSALALGGTYVAHRQKQSGTPESDAEGKAVLPSSKNPNRITVLPSSKSSDAVIFPSSPGSPSTNSDFIQPIEPAAETAEEKKRALLGEIQHLWNDDKAENSSGGPATGEKQKRALLPSSKIGSILSPDDAPINRNNIDAILDEQRKKENEEKK